MTPNRKNTQNTQNILYAEIQDIQLEMYKGISIYLSIYLFVGFMKELGLQCILQVQFFCFKNHKIWNFVHCPKLKFAHPK